MAEAFFRKNNDLFQWVQPNGGATAFPRLMPPYGVTEMCERAMEEKELLIIGERAYGLNTNHFRVGLGRLDFAQALAVFSDIVDEVRAAEAEQKKQS